MRDSVFHGSLYNVLGPEVLCAHEECSWNFQEIFPSAWHLVISQ